MTTITIKNATSLTKTEFEDLEDLRAYLSSNEFVGNDSESLGEYSSRQLGELWDQGIDSGEPEAFDSKKQQAFLKQLEAKHLK